MRAEIATAERQLEVREAAAGWRDAGAIDDPTFRAIEAAYPDDRVRLKLWIRVLAFLATLIGAGALAALVAMVIQVDRSLAWFSAFLAVICVVATEIQTGRLRRAQCGSETATALLAALFAWLVLVSWWKGPSFGVYVGAFSVLSALAAYRWGSLILTGVSVISAFALVARWPHGRLHWLLLAALLVPLAYRGSRSLRFPPSHRRSAEVVAVVSSIAAYVAINLYSLDESFVEAAIGDRGVETSPSWLRWLAAAGTALLPAALLAAGIVLRNRMGLVLGAASIAASLATVRYYHPIGPLWLCLTLGGGSCLAIALGLRQWMSSAAGKERSGFTAEPLFESARGREAAKIAAAIASLGPAPRTAPERPFEGGGGLSGGGGASGTS